MNLPTNVTRVFYQFHKPSNSSKPTWHVANLNFMNLPNRLYKYSKPISYIVSHFVVFVFSTSQLLILHSLLSWCSLVPLCIHLEASNLYVDCFLVFLYNTSKLEASYVSSSLAFDNYTSKQATQTPMWLECSISWIRLWEERWPHEQSTKLWVMCKIKFNNFVKLILWGYEYGYQLMKLFTTWIDIGWMLNSNWVYIANTVHDSN